MSTRADIIETGIPQLKSASIVINAPAKKIFDIIAQPRMHPVIDGSNSVKSVIYGPDHLYLGAKFGMNMKLGIKYRITNTVVEYKENELIAWRHLGRWVWRYELKELSPTSTLVTESFDGRPSPLQWWLNVRKAYGYSQIAVAKTLVRLKESAESKK